MIHVIATIELRPGTRAAFIEEFARLVPDVRRESGCIYYAGGVDLQTDHPSQEPVRPDVFVVVERWANLGALTAHGSAPHMQAWRERVKGSLVCTRLQVLEPAGEPA
jgi:quinol monooxygenase YgiN